MVHNKCCQLMCGIFSCHKWGWELQISGCFSSSETNSPLAGLDPYYVDYPSCTTHTHQSSDFSLNVCTDDTGPNFFCPVKFGSLGACIEGNCTWKKKILGQLLTVLLIVSVSCLVRLLITDSTLMKWKKRLPLIFVLMQCCRFTSCEGSP